MIIAPPSHKTLRQQLRKNRRSLSALAQRKAAKNLYKQLYHHPLFRNAKHIALYLASDGEIDPYLLVNAAKQLKKNIYFPVLLTWPKYQMIFQKISSQTQWDTNIFGMKQPKFNRHQQIKPICLDLVLMPLVGFDEGGGRLGMGGGFYDRYFSYLPYRTHWKKPYLLGVAHECQKVNKLTLNKWDILTIGTVTDQHWYLANASHKEER